ncbi:MAG: aminoglycoside 6-adenylyltransferase [Phycicoccus sp.]
MPFSAVLVGAQPTSPLRESIPTAAVHGGSGVQVAGLERRDDERGRRRVPIEYREGPDRPPPTYRHIVDRFIRFAEARDDLRAAVIVGSRARTDRPADSLSDLDVVVVTTEPNRYVEDAEWLKQLGTADLRRAPGRGVWARAPCSFRGLSGCRLLRRRA